MHTNPISMSIFINDQGTIQKRERKINITVPFVALPN